MNAKLVVGLFLLIVLIVTLITGKFGLSLVMAIALFLMMLPLPKNKEEDEEHEIDAKIEELDQWIHATTGG